MERSQNRRAEPPAEGSGAGAEAPLLVPGRSCWRVAPARRAALLVDGAAYFEALTAAMGRARRSIRMVGWDFHSRVRLRRGEGATALPSELAEHLSALAERRRELEVHVLGWDFAMLYALEREALPLYRLGVRTHRRVHFRLDDEHPVGASHHQKIVVIDDAVAFAGGFDLAPCRWDTREHRAHHPERSDPGFDDYPPFHDVQMIVEGEPAQALGALVRERWRIATGHPLGSGAAPSDPWPPGVEADFQDVPVGIARTVPAWEDGPEVREVERLHVDAVDGARETIYLENQYLSSVRVADALEARLLEPEGPEVVVVGPSHCSGWLEEVTMGVLRARLLARLREADRFGRLRVYHPVVPELEAERPMQVHSKLAAVDDRVLRVGSANLSNRSMGLDTECDLAIDATGRPRDRARVQALRDDLVAEHLGTTAERVAEAVEAKGSLGAAIEALRGGPRTLAPLDPSVPEWMEELVPAEAFADPERPVSLERLVERLAPEVETDGRRRRALLATGAAAALLLGLAALWRWGPLADSLAPAELVGFAAPLGQSPLGAVVAALGVAVAGSLMVPVTALIVACGLLFGPLVGFAAGYGGALASAAAGYGVGRVLWRDTVRRLAGRRLNALSQALSRRGVSAMILVRVVPIAPFGMVNLVAGASQLRFGDYMLGTALAMAPGTFALALLADRVALAVSEPGWRTVVTALALGLGLVLGLRAFQRRVERAQSEPPPPGAAGNDG